jgi:hypothetical protein
MKPSAEREIGMETVGPRARTNRLVAHELGHELLVYDLERHTAYCLNEVAMQVFRHCDGETTIPDMARRVGTALGVPVDDQAVLLALLRLQKAHLLDGTVGLPRHSSRRAMLRTLGRAAAVIVPLVTAISVPTAAAAGSCKAKDFSPCEAETPCCSGTGNCDKGKCKK